MFEHALGERIAALHADAVLRTGDPVSGLCSGVDCGALDGEWRFHDEVEAAVGLYQEREILIFILAGILAGTCYSEDSPGVLEEGVPEPGFHANDLSAVCAVFRPRQINFSLDGEPVAVRDRLIGMTAQRMQVSEALRNAYRSTFDEYANKLNTLQRLMNDGDAKEHQIEAALRDVEDARVAHSHARDQLAKELMRRTAEAGVPADEKPLLQAASVC